MLNQRLLTGAVMIAALWAALNYLATMGVTVLFGALIGVAAWEWGALAGVGARGRLGFALAVVGLGALVIVVLPRYALVLWSALAYWLWATWAIVNTGVQAAPRPVWARLLCGLPVFIPAWTALYLLHRFDPASPWLLLYFFALVASVDTAAFVVGRAWGRRRLAPRLSPGKTVEGLLGGLGAAAALAWAAGTWGWDLRGGGLLGWVILSVSCAAASVIGDLFESAMKRRAGVKDSGRLFPGHGGVMDRGDSITAALPLFALGWAWLEGVRW